MVVDAVPLALASNCGQLLPATRNKPVEVIWLVEGVNAGRGLVLSSNFLVLCQSEAPTLVVDAFSGGSFIKSGTILISNMKKPFSSHLVGGRHQPNEAMEWFLLSTFKFLNQVEAPTTVVGAVPMALSSNHGQLSSAT
jgi:hypothetical protein